MQQREIAIQAAQAGAEAIRAGFRRAAAHEHTDKGHLDFATETDVESERRIVAILTQRFPDYGVLAEEGGWVAGGPDSRFSWLIDPLCGTLNFAAGIPIFNVNITLLERGQPVLAVLAEPLAHEVLWAEAGSGAHLVTADGQERPVRPAGNNRLLGLDFGHYPTRGEPYTVLEAIRRATLSPRYRLRMFSSSLGLGYVAQGRLAAHIIDQARPWDLAAGAFICREAGCVVTDIAGQPWQAESHSVFAAVDQAVHDEVWTYVDPTAAEQPR